MSESVKPKPAQENGLLRLLIDYVPLAVFFLVYKFNAPGTSNDVVGTIAAVITSTGAFMVAIVVAAIVAKWKLGRISPMMWLTTILVMGFGGLTLYFHDPSFIQRKPTYVYLLLGGLLIGGLLMGKSLMKFVFEAGYDGLSERGWYLMSRNWGIFFLILAVLNEIIWRNYSFDTWLTIKVWGATALSFVFAAAQIPMLLKHGLGDDPEPKADEPGTAGNDA